MKNVAAATAASLATLSGALAQTALFINTPASLVECQPTLLAFGGGTAPYYISVLPGGQTSATALEQFAEQTGTSYTWTVNLASGTNVTLSIRDSTGAVNYDSPVVIQAGSSTSCLNATASSAASSAGAVATSAVTTTVASSSSSSSSSVSATSTSSAAAATSTTVASGTQNYTFTCAEGDLAYAITRSSLSGVSLSSAVKYFTNWTATAPGTTVNTTGSGVGAKRSYTLNGNVTLDEVLILDNTTAPGLHQQWNATHPGGVAVTSNLTFYSAFDDLAVFTNSSTNETGLQLWSLGCFNDQATGQVALMQTLEAEVAYWLGKLNGSSSTNSTAATRARRSVQLF